jgi:purine-binding chemotaxis protein CheW
MNDAQVVVFFLNGMQFGADTKEIEEVMRYDVLHKSQNCSESKEHSLPCMEGYANVRGSMIPVVNLGKYLGLEEAAISYNAKIILARANENLAGFIVDNVTEIMRLDENSIKKAPGIITTPENECIEKFVIKDEFLFPVIRFESILKRNQG